MEPISALFGVATTIIERVWPDKAQQDAAKLKLIELQQSGELAALASETNLALGQIETNKIEAGSGSLFVSGWRPGAGWVCVVGLGYSFIMRPILAWVSVINGWDAPPELDMGDLLTLLGGLLGLGTVSMFERIRGVARVS